MVARRHVLDVSGHGDGQVVLVDDLRVSSLELEQVLLELVVTQQGVLVVGGIVNDSTKELRATSPGNSEHKQENERH